MKQHHFRSVDRIVAATVVMILSTATSAKDVAIPETSSILAGINSAYEEIADLPRHMILMSRTTTRQHGRPDQIVESRAEVDQHGKAIRFEIPPGSMRIDEGGKGQPDALVPVQDSQLWTLIDQVMQSRYINHDRITGEAIVSEFFVDFARVPEHFGQRFHNPITAPELPVEFMEAQWIVSEAILHGKAMWKMRSRETIPLSPVAAMDVILYVDRETHLVARMENVSYRINPDTGDSAAQVHQATGIAYEIGAQIDPATFEVELGPAARDLTEQSIEYLRTKLLWRQETLAN
ncbi:hypothetical protein [Sagittula salina]|uniref:Uncharacterized protein n=1 Tax=Sagittula salina TaxID=2820268 RepID=A0A940MNF3_9RHOB|nr:hypothetical protein [Sagittula salina]MBP0482788.1 hypothetical protein [Sagittula salina]